jgi:ribose/xylose/arabinose/galactoside ABC-type transport system permease subunit
MPDTRTQTPEVAWIYGLLGLIPFVGGAAGAVLDLDPGGGWWRTALAIYGALILSFLGGARWGLEIARPRVRPLVITASMAPSIAGFLLLLAPPHLVWLTLEGLALGHLLQWAWDLRSRSRPPWYPRLRTLLTTGAVVSLLVGAAAS